MSTQTEPQLFDVPAVLIEARYRERLLCARLLPARSGPGFTVGSGRRADAPIDPSFLPPLLPANDNHTLVTPSAAGFFVNLSPAMVARCERTATRLRVPCGEVVFDISAAAPAPVVPRTWLRAGAGADARVTGAVALGFVLLLALVRAVPDDPHALSLDDLGRDIRLGTVRVLPLVVPEVPPVPVARGPSGGGAVTAAVGPSGEAGTRAARPSDSRRATKGPATRQDARDVETHVRTSTMLALLDPSRGGAFADVMGAEPALGAQAENALAHLVGTQLADAWGTGVLGPHGTGGWGADTGRAMIGGPPGLNMVGVRDGRGGPDGGYGHEAGSLGTRQTRKIEVAMRETVRGRLDREIVRRVVRQHLNEVRYCYEQALARHPTLAGRVVAQFTIAPTGRVLLSALQSSSLGEPAVEGCIIAATRRWTFPAPDGGGLVLVSYPFQLTPAGG